MRKLLLPSSPFQHSTILGSPFLDFPFLRLSLGHSPFLQSPFDYFPHLGLSDFSDKDCFVISHELSASDGNKPLEGLSTTCQSDAKSGKQKVRVLYRRSLQVAQLELGRPLSRKTHLDALDDGYGPITDGRTFFNPYSRIFVDPSGGIRV